MIADMVTPFDELREKRAEAVQIHLEAAQLDDDLVDELRRAVAAHHGDVELYLEVARPGAFQLVARAEAALAVSPSRTLTRQLESLVGPGRVRYRARPGR